MLYFEKICNLTFLYQVYEIYKIFRLYLFNIFSSAIMKLQEYKINYLPFYFT